MMNSPSDYFYEQVKGFDSFSSSIYLENYQPVPADWYLVISDIENSTLAIKSGKYKDVNSVSAATIMAVLNAVMPVKIPYIFGGDGATMCVPPSKKDSVASALLAAKIMAREGLHLNLRIGMVPVSYIEEQGFQVLIAKYQPSDHFQQAMMIGEGIGFAESLIKNPEQSSRTFVIDEELTVPEGNFNGFECRWDRIKSPSEQNISLLIQALEKDEVKNSEIYREVMARIYDIYGNEQQHHPINIENLRLANSLAKLSGEARVKSGSSTFRFITTLVRIALLVLAGRWMMKKNITTKHTEWGGYKQRLIDNTDYRRMENSLKFLLAGKSAQQTSLREYLDKLKRQGKVVYGIHTSDSATITCLVFNYNQDHIHFLDGSDGGFTMAAVELKAQLKEKQARVA